MHDVSAVCLHWNRLSLSPTTDRLVLVSVPKTAPLCPNVAVGTSVLFSLAFSSPEIWTANEVLALSSHESTALFTFVTRYGGDCLVGLEHWIQEVVPPGAPASARSRALAL